MTKSSILSEIRRYFLVQHVSRSLLAILGYSLKIGLVIGIPLITKYILDSVIPEREIHLLVKWSLIIFTAQITLIILGIGNTYLANILKFGFNNEFRKRLLKRVLGAKASSLLERGTGYLVARTEGDIEGIGKFIVEDTLTFIYSLITLVVTGILVAGFNTTLALSFLLVLPFFAVSLKVFNKGMKDRTDAVQEARSVASSSATEIIAGRREVKILGLEGKFIKTYSKLLKHYYKSIIDRFLYSCKPAVLGQFSSALGKVALVGVGGYEIIRGRLSFGEFFAFNMLMAHIFRSVGQLVNINISLQTGLGCLRRVNAIFRLPQEKQSGIEIEEANTLALRNVNFRYGTLDQSFAIQDISFAIHKGEILALAGISGAGKSTIFNLVRGVYRPDKGTVYIDNTNLYDISPSSRSRLFAVVQQDPFLFSMSIRENIRLGRLTASDEEISLAVEQAQLSDFVNSLDNGLDHTLNERGSNLSGGQKQRILIARALLQDASILLLDEATTGLDMCNIRAFHNLLDQIKKERIVLIVGHSRETMLIADQIVLLDEGKIVSRGTHAKLIRTCSHYQRIFQELAVDQGIRNDNA